MKVNISDLVEAIEMADRYTDHYLDLQTGEIVRIHETEMSKAEREEALKVLSGHGCLRLPSRFEIHEFEIMASFAASRPEPAGERLSRALSDRRGAYRHFTEEIERLGLAKQWADWEREACQKKALRWCREHGIEFEQA